MLAILVFTLCADLSGAHQVTFVAHKDNRCVGMALPQQQAQLSHTLETVAVGQWEYQYAHFTL